MRLIGKILLFLLGGFVSGMAWVLSGVLWCIIIFGIPFEIQFFKNVKLALSPFGATIVHD